jgi:O-antigen/teichoic acid export membrane protein
MNLNSWRLYRDICVRGSSDIIILVLNLLILPVVTKKLGDTGFGVYSQIMVTVAFVTPLLLFRFNTACVRYFPHIMNDISELKNKFFIIMILLVGVTLLFVFTIYFKKDFFSTITFGTNKYASLINYILIFIFVRVTGTYVSDFFRAINKSNYSSIFEAMRFLFILLLVLLTLQEWHLGIKGLLISYIVAEIILVAIFFAIIWLKFLQPATPIVFSLAGLRPYLKYSTPLVAYSVLIWVNDCSDRYLITHLIGIKQAGVYSLAYTLTKYALFLQSSIAFVIFPHISCLWIQGERGQVKLFLEKGQNLFLFMAIPIVAGLTFLSPHLIRFIAGEEFLVSRNIIFMIALGYLCCGIYQIHSYIIDLSQKTIWFLIVLAISSLVNIILNLLLIPKIGISGAAFSTFITYFVQAVIVYAIARNLINIIIDINIFYILKCIMASIIMLLIINYIHIKGGILSLIFSIFIGAVTYMLFMTLASFRLVRNVLRTAVYQFINLRKV